ncbi:MAG: uroporphyrinogen-III synthase [Mycobacteriales bacterium]|nr:MAG: bifunctional uroporphyrinogen-III C-methyltransferase/uroporphyrinogen-III synthase [Pseudonocardiales bacterium]
MTRARKPTGRITFVGAGPGDPGLLTVHAAAALETAVVVVADPGLPRAILDRAGGEIATAEGGPAAIAKALVAHARAGHDVVRLVSGDPMTTDAVVKECQAVARTSLSWRVVPGVVSDTAVPAYAGVAAGSSRTAIDVRGDAIDGIDWAGIAGAPGTVIATVGAADVGKVAAALVEHGRRGDSPASLSVRGTLDTERTVDTTLEAAEADASDLESDADVILTVGPAVARRGRLAWWETRPLYGWRVLVPRTRDQAGAMTPRLADYGAMAEEVPTIAVEPPRTPAQVERAIKGLVTGRYEWIVFTSANAVRAVREKFEEFGLDARAFAGVKIACIGEPTADVVRAYGITPELIPSGEQSSDGLLADFPPYDEVLDPIDRVLLPRADIATEALAAGLTERGWEVDDVTAYRTVRAAPPPAPVREAIKSGGFDAVCFTSSSTVRNLVGIAGKPHARTIVACIGPKTAETAAEFGLRVDVQPEVAEVPALVDALAAYAADLLQNGAASPPSRRPARGKPSRR